MRLSETSTGFTPVVDSGRFGFRIIPSLSGEDFPTEELAKQASCFDNIIIEKCGYSDIFGQANDLNNLIRHVIRVNPNALFRIYTDAKERPILIKSASAKFYINIALKSEGKSYEERVNSKALIWFENAGACFIFYIADTNDFDEAMMIVQDVGLAKRRVFMVPKTAFSKDSFMNLCRQNGVNFSIDIYNGGELL